MALSQVTFWLFAAFSGMRLFSYLPQIRRVANDPNGASAISYSTWALWTGANIATALYATVNLKELYLASVSALYAGCCMAVIALTALKRRRVRTGSGRTDREPPMADKTTQRKMPRNPVEVLQAYVQKEAAARLLGRPVDPDFERQVANHCRRIVCDDLADAIVARAMRR